MIKMRIILRWSKLLINWQSSKDNAEIQVKIYAIVSVNKCPLLANKKVILL